MSERERLRREDPVRAGPIRNWSALYRRSDSWDLHDASSQPAGETSEAACSDPVSHGVELGYRVLQEQIRQGQRIAEQLSSQSYNSGAMAGDLREVADRAWRYLTDLGALWVDFLSSIARDGELLRKLYGAWQPPGWPSASATTGGTLGIAIDVSCDRPVRVALQLRPHSEGASLVCQALRALEAEKPPVTEVAFERDADGVLTLRIRVPDAHPPGVYIGTVIDSDTVQPRGTLSVTVA